MSEREPNWEQVAEQMLRSYPPPLGQLIGRALSTADDKRGVMEAILASQVVASSAVVVIGASGIFEDYDAWMVKHLEMLMGGLSDADALAVVGIHAALEGLLVDGPAVRLVPTKRSR